MPHFAFVLVLNNSIILPHAMRTCNGRKVLILRRRLVFLLEKSYNLAVGNK